MTIRDHWNVTAPVTLEWSSLLTLETSESSSPRFKICGKISWHASYHHILPLCLASFLLCCNARIPSCHNCTECLDGVFLNHAFRFNKSFAWGERSKGQPQTAQWLTGLQTQPVPDQPEPSWWRNHHDGEQRSRVHHAHQQEHSSEFLGYTGIISISAVISDSCGEDC